MPNRVITAEEFYQDAIDIELRRLGELWATNGKKIKKALIKMATQELSFDDGQLQKIFGSNHKAILATAGPHNPNRKSFWEAFTHLKRKSPDE